MKRQHKSLLRPKKGDYFELSLVSDIHYNSEAIDDLNFPSLTSPPMIYYTVAKKLNQYVDFVNIQKPDVVVCLGDVIDGPNYETSFDEVMGIWNRIDGSIPTVIAAGNHDYYSAVPAPRMEYVSNKFGYGSNPVVAMSKMNVSVSIPHPVVDVRVINFESNISPTLVFNSAGGFYPQDMLDWIESEIKDNPEDIIILTTHKYRNHIDIVEKTKLENMLTGLKTTHPKKKIYILFGHSHIPMMYRFTSEVGGFEMFNCSALVDNIESEFYTIYIDKEGIRGFDIHWTDYNR